MFESELLFEKLLPSINEERKEQESQNLDFATKNRRYLDIVKDVMRPYIEKTPKTKDITPFIRTRGIVSSTSHFVNVKEASLSMLGLESILAVGDKESIIWRVFKLLKDYRANSKRLGFVERSSNAKIAINTLYGLVANNWFAHMGLPFSKVSDEMHRRIKEMIVTIKNTGATILTVDVDTVLYVGDEVQIDGVHNITHKSVILTETGHYMCYSNMPVSRSIPTRNINNRLKERSEQILMKAIEI